MLLPSDFMDITLVSTAAIKNCFACSWRGYLDSSKNTNSMVVVEENTPEPHTPPVIAPTASGLNITAVISVSSQCLIIPVTGFLHSDLQTKLFQYQHFSELHIGAVKYISGRRKNVCSVVLL